MGLGPQDLVRNILERNIQNHGSRGGMVPIKGEMLILFLTHKLIKYLGNDNAKAIKYIGIWNAAKKKNLIKIEAPQKLKDAVRKTVEETGAKFYQGGVMEINGKQYDCNRMLDETMRESLGPINLVSYKSEAEAKYPGILDLIEKSLDKQGEEYQIKKMAHKAVLVYLNHK